MLSSFRSIIIDFYVIVNNIIKTNLMEINPLSLKLIRQVPLIEGLVVFDGLISACKFTIEYIYLK